MREAQEIAKELSRARNAAATATPVTAAATNTSPTPGVKNATTNVSMTTAAVAVAAVAAPTNPTATGSNLAEARALRSGRGTSPRCRVSEPTPMAVCGGEKRGQGKHTPPTEIRFSGDQPAPGEVRKNGDPLLGVLLDQHAKAFPFEAEVTRRDGLDIRVLW